MQSMEDRLRQWKQQKNRLKETNTNIPPPQWKKVNEINKPTKEFEKEEKKNEVRKGEGIEIVEMNMKRMKSPIEGRTHLLILKVRLTDEIQDKEIRTLKQEIQNKNENIQNQAELIKELRKQLKEAQDKWNEYIVST